MARIDAIVLGAGIVGTSIALHLAKRGLAVALVDRRGPGEETSYGNAGVIEGNTHFSARLSVGPVGAAAGRAQAGDGGQLSPDAFCRRSGPGCWPFAPPRARERLMETARVMRPLFARAVAEHEALLAEAGAEPLFAQGRLAQALSQRRAPSRRSSGELALAQELRHCLPSARHRRGA